MITGILILAYALPKTLFWVPSLLWILLVLVLAPVAFEAWRVPRKVVVPGLRKHEAHRLASYAWFLTGSATLLVFFAVIWYITYEPGKGESVIWRDIKDIAKGRYD